MANSPIKNADMNMALNDLCIRFCTLNDAYNLLESYIYADDMHKDNVDKIKEKVLTMLELMQAFTRKLQQDTEGMIDIDNALQKKLEKYELGLQHLSSINQSITLEK